MSLHGPDLGDALEALRELGDGDGDPGTRDRVLDSLDRRGQRHRTVTAFAIVLALSFTGTTAWGWFSGWIPAMVRTIVDDTPPRVEQPVAPRKPARREAAPAKRPAAHPEPAPEPVPAAVPVVAETPPPVASPPAPTRAVIPRRPAVAKPTPRESVSGSVSASPAPPSSDRDPLLDSPPVPAPTPTPAAPPPSAELRLYRVAHDSHFHGSDAQRALAAWDTYLASFPDGKLALEARWNRALVLVKLGRTDDALRALEPFASGSAGGYRQREASKLGDALRARAP